MSKKATSCVVTFILTSMALLCIVALLAGWAWVTLPARAEAQFGSPRPGLSSFQRVYLSARLLQQAQELSEPLDSAAQSQPFKVALGEPAYMITGRLQSDGLIRDGGALQDYLAYSGLDTSLQAGEFSLAAAMSAVEIAKAMQDATPTEVSFNILPGWRLEEIAAALPTSGLSFASQAFLSAASNPALNSPILQEMPVDASAEGFLFPGEYTFKRDVTLNEFLTTLLDQFATQITPDLRQGFERQGLSLFEAVIIASIVQREAVVDDEMPMIASVYLNRRVAEMKLEADPTVQYALGFYDASGSWWKSPLSLDDLQVRSAYNTYQILGLPPGPIANPGLKALQAVAFPAQTPYFYFRAACDESGRHAFAENFAGQLGNACP